MFNPIVPLIHQFFSLGYYSVGEEIASRFPEANIITEESLREFDENREFTFAVDPIDGTDPSRQDSTLIRFLKRIIRPFSNFILCIGFSLIMVQR
ncbi:MAG TPA: hypothetical protein ENI06_04235 [Spirochaetales bacterium]|nr:hypothetical protein [Spirochaetales bacterium]